MAQQSWNLYAVGYEEPAPSAPDYPYVPLPPICAHCGAPDPGIGPEQCGCSGMEEETIRSLHRLGAIQS